MIRKSLKEEKAITLVALIITIIVLLILAMVSISLVMNGGIIDKSKSAVDKYSGEEIQEQLKLAYSEYQMSQYTDTPLDIQAKLQEIFGNDNVQDVSVSNGKISAKINGIAYEYDTATGKAGKDTSLGAQITKDNYGDYIDLGQSVVGTESTADDWRILYNDKNGYIYAILADYLPNNNAAVTASGLHIIDNTIYNVNCAADKDDLVDKLNSTIAWQSLISERLRGSCQVKGATTLDIILASYNEKYSINPAKKKYDFPNFYINNNSTNGMDTLYIPHPYSGENAYNGCYGYWLASSNSDTIRGVWRIKNGNLDYTGYDDERFGVCPVVSLPSNLQVTSSTSNGVTVWSLAE